MRNRYTSLVRIRERAQLARQEKQLIHLICQLRRGITDSPDALPRLDAKTRRSARLAQRCLHKPNRQDHDTDSTTA